MNEQHFRHHVQQTAHHLGVWLVGRFDGIGLQQIESLFHQQRILVNNQPALPNQPLKAGDVVEIYRRFIADIIPDNLPIDILFEDEDLLVINKAAGMPVHPGLGHYRGTLLNALAHYYEERQEKDALLRGAVVHRLDKDTSGIVILAKTLRAKKQLDLQFRDAHVHRTYQALVWGELPYDEGVIDVAVGRLPEHSHLLAADPSAQWGKLAITRYKVIERLENQTWLTLLPETGRTHQIRIHLHWLGHPIVGDKRYVHPQWPSADRLHLHAQAILFKHPISLEPIHIKCPFVLDKNV